MATSTSVKLVLVEDGKEAVLAEIDVANAGTHSLAHVARASIVQLANAMRRNGAVLTDKAVFHLRTWRD